ncbi:MAG: penicillin acylase family protein [Bacteroidota bacterium]
MRFIPLIISATITIILVAVLNMKMGSTPPVGPLLSPSHGFWKNAEPTDYSFSSEILSEDLRQAVTVSLDERLVPHVFAQNDHDAYLVQGYLHARFRLWQMEFQTYAAAGRLSEILGEKLGNNSIIDVHDRRFRRMGMTIAAENSVKATNADPMLKEALEAYSKGINLYIRSLKPEDYPIEYKLLNYAPEAWSPYKTALILKYMSYDLTTDFDDFDNTDLMRQLGLQAFETLNPLQHDSVSPIVTKGTAFIASRPLPVKPIKADSLMGADTSMIAMITTKRDPDNGSNNWVVSGSKTTSGRPILCNDPHLGLNLPSLWYEMQINTPEYNVTGVSLPGAPSVIIGFNDSIAWGVTNGSRDVMDFYEVEFKDATMNEYWYDSAWQPTSWRVENYRIKGKPAVTDSIAITLWGPVMYDTHYQNSYKDGKNYAVRWTAHDESVEGKAFMQLNRATNYRTYLAAIKLLGNPAQNFAFGSKRNTIAMWQSGKLPAKWKLQGDFIMPGTDSTFKWQGFIPFEDMVHEVNPARGFVSSANQLPADTTYPYYLGGTYDMYRGFIINRMLAADSNISITDMQKMQTSTYDVFAEQALPMMLKNVDSNILTQKARGLLGICGSWNYDATANANGKTVFESWWKHFKDTIYRDDFRSYSKKEFPVETDQTLLEGIKRDSAAYRFIDNRNTPQKESLRALLAAALNTAANLLPVKPLDWGEYKGAQLNHLLRIPAFSQMNLYVGGGKRIINAVKGSNGPSWRMIVELTDETVAYGVYPGGQQGNPGSKFYTQFAGTWAAGKYYRLLVMKASETKSDKVKWTMEFKKA